MELDKKAMLRWDSAAPPRQGSKESDDRQKQPDSASTRHAGVRGSRIIRSETAFILGRRRAADRPALRCSYCKKVHAFT